MRVVSLVGLVGESGLSLVDGTSVLRKLDIYYVEIARWCGTKSQTHLKQLSTQHTHSHMLQTILKMANVANGAVFFFLFYFILEYN